MRDTGIEVIGSAPWGTHFCQFYETARDLTEILVPYFAAGLRQNEFCMWVTSEPLGVEEAKAALEAAVGELGPYLGSGQLEILDYGEWYTAGGKFDASRVLQGWVDRLAAAQAKGFEGLRLTGNTFWLEQSDWRDFTQYEATVDSVIGRYRMLAICTYSLRKCGAPELLDVMANHAFALIKRGGEWQIIESAERRRVEQALRDSEQRWAATLASIGDAVIAADPSGRITFLNPTAEGLTGWALGEAIGRPVEEVFRIVNERTREKVENPVTRALREGRVVGLANHTVLIARDGKELPIDDSGAPIRNERGEVTGVVLVFRDISERRRAEEAVRQAREDLERAQEVSQIGSWRLDVRRNVLTWSQETHRIFGLPAGTPMSYETFLASVHPDDREYVDARWQAGLRGEPYEVEHRIVVGGEVKWVREKAFLEVDDAGELLGGFGIVQDISERKQAEEALLKSEAALRRSYQELEQRVLERTAELRAASGYARRLIEASLDPLVTISREGRITDVNHATEVATGVPRQRLIGTDFSGYFTEPEKAEAGYQQVIARGEVRDYPLTIRHSSGRTVDVLYNATVYRDEAGRAQGVFAAARDITERKRTEEELARYREHLEELVRERTAQLEAANEQLRREMREREQAEEALLEAERARRRLAEAMVSEVGHRTKNNLAIVAGLLQMQMDQVAAGASGPELIRDAVARILSFAALHEQMYQSRSDSIELVDALRRIGEISRQSLSTGELEIAVEGGPVHYPSGVGTNICVVANELLTNAIKHGGRGDGQGRVEVKVSAEGGKLMLSVWNSDSEIAAGFDLTKASRTGLGLVHTIVVDQYGGSFALLADRGGVVARITLEERRLTGGG
ncbi:MAG: PAS domain S-box protein [Armatimonadota bacterium]